jgi:hypothetical protein
VELSDALKILAVRSHFDDLDLALRYVGCTRSDTASPPAVAGQETTGPLADELRLEAADNELVQQRIDGWFLANEGDLDAAVRDAETTQDGDSQASDPEPRPTARPRPGLDPATKHQPARAAARFIVPMLLTGEEPPEGPAPVYASVKQRSLVPFQPRTGINSVINPRTAATAMHSLLERPAQSSEIDVNALIQRLSLVLPITSTPRLSRNMAVPRMYLLYDTTLLIGPYADDVQQLVQLARALFDSDALDIQAFRKSLHSGCGHGPIWTWTPFRFPAQPTTMAFISGSFGGDLADKARELNEVIAELERKGHHARVLWLGTPPVHRPSMERSWRVITT